MGVFRLTFLGGKDNPWSVLVRIFHQESHQGILLSPHLEKYIPFPNTYTSNALVKVWEMALGEWEEESVHNFWSRLKIVRKKIWKEGKRKTHTKTERDKGKGKRRK